MKTYNYYSYLFEHFKTRAKDYGMIWVEPKKSVFYIDLEEFNMSTSVKATDIKPDDVILTSLGDGSVVANRVEDVKPVNSNGVDIIALLMGGRWTGYKADHVFADVMVSTNATSLSAAGQPEKTKSLADYPGKCPQCSGPAYWGANVIDCMRGCK